MNSRNRTPSYIGDLEQCREQIRSSIREFTEAMQPKPIEVKIPIKKAVDKIIVDSEIQRVLNPHFCDTKEANRLRATRAKLRDAEARIKELDPQPTAQWRFRVTSSNHFSLTRCIHEGFQENDCVLTIEPSGAVYTTSITECSSNRFHLSVEPSEFGRVFCFNNAADAFRYIANHLFES